MKCTECGKKIDDNSTVCPLCGADLLQDDYMELEIIDAFDEEEVFLDFEEVEDDSESTKTLNDAVTEEVDSIEPEAAVAEIDIYDSAEPESEEEDSLELEELEELGELEELEAIEELEELDLEESDDDDYEPYVVPEFKLEDEPKIEIKLTRKQYKENELMLEWDDIKHRLKVDKRRVKILVCLLVAVVGSFFNFWGLSTELARPISMGSLFVGYGVLGSWIGKICVLGIVVTAGLLLVNLTTYSFFGALTSCILVVVQGILNIVLTYSPGFEYVNIDRRVYFDLGFYIMAVALVFSILLLRRAGEVVEEEADKPSRAELKQAAKAAKEKAKQDAIDAKEKAKQDAIDAKNAKEKAKQDAIDAKAKAKQDAIDAKNKTKQDAIDAKAKAKQDAIDAKNKAKQDAIDAKEKAKQDAIDAKAKAKQDAMDAKQAKKNSSGKKNKKEK